MTWHYPFGELKWRGFHPDSDYSRLRQNEPVCRVRLPFGGEAWLATSHAIAKMVLADPRFSRAKAVGHDTPRPWPRVSSASGIAHVDAPVHTRVRKLVAIAFQASRDSWSHSQLREIVDHQLAGLASPADIVGEFAQPVMIAAICRQLGVSPAYYDNVREWTDQLTGLVEYPSGELADSQRKLTELLQNMIVERRQRPTGDLLSALVEARDGEGSLADEVIIVLGRQLLTGGIDNTATQLSGSLYALLTHPDQLALLNARPELLPKAMEELLRFVPLAHATIATVATEDMRFGNVTVRAGEFVFASLAAANRDEAVFGSPDVLDITRRVNRHLGLGYGSHFCIGAPMVRAVMEVVLRAFLPRLLTAELVEPATFRLGYQTYGLDRLVLRWNPDGTGSAVPVHAAHGAVRMPAMG